MNRKMFTGLLLIVIVSLLVVNYNTSKKDQIHFKSKQQTFESINYDFNNGDLELAKQKINYLIKQNQRNYLYIQNMGIVSVMLGNSEKAVDNYAYALELNPYLIKDNQFLLNYSKITLQANKPNQTMLILKQLKKSPNLDNNMEEEINKLISNAKELSKDEENE